MAVVQINKDPTKRQLNQFGFIWMGFLALFTVLSWLKLHEPRLSGTLAVLAVVVPVIGWLVPAFMKIVFIGLSYAAWPIGFVVSHVVLAVVYYLVFTPVGLLMRLFGYDPMQRRFDPQAETYWHPRPDAETDPKRYFRQF